MFPGTIPQATGRRTRREEDRTAENVSQLGKGPLEELKLGRDRRETQRREAGFEEANLWGRRCRLWNLECQVMEKSGHCLEGGTQDPGEACARSREVLSLFNAPDSVLHILIVDVSICLAGKDKSLPLRQTPDESVSNTSSRGTFSIGASGLCDAMRMTSRQPREQQNSRASTGHHSLSSHTKTHQSLSSFSSRIVASETPSAASHNAHTKTPASQSKPTFKLVDPFGRPGRLIQSTASPKKKSPVAEDKTTPVVSPSQPASFKPVLSLCCLALSMHLLLPQRGVPRVAYACHFLAAVPSLFSF